MAISTGARHALGEAISWVILAACAVALFIFYDDVKSAIQVALDLPTPASEAAAMDQSHASPPYRRRIKSAAGNSVIELNAGPYGQFRANADINGSDTKVLIDTGASSVALTDEDARSAGIFPNPGDYTIRIRTANGVGRAAPVMLDSITVGDITVHDVPALVNEPGTLHVTLLGMTFLNRLSRVDIRAGKMVLKE